VEERKDSSAITREEQEAFRGFSWASDKLVNELDTMNLEKYDAKLVSNKKH